MIRDFAGSEGPVNGIFMIKQATEAVSNSGSHYLSMTLQDTSGTIDAKKWAIEDDDVAICTPGSLIRINGMASVYRGHPQLKINDLEPVGLEEVDISKYVPMAPTPLEEMKKTLKEYIGLIKDKELHDLTDAIIQERYEAYTTYPAAVTVHHAFVGGLMYHSLSICSMALKTVEQYPELSRDYLIAGSLLHDIGKTVELSGATATSYTEEGNLLGHISLGAMIVYSKGKELHVNEEKLMVLTHMILAHHGEYEFGSPKQPMTAEAFVLHELDELDAKLATLHNAYAATAEGAYTGRIVWMENQNFYKPHKLD